MLCRGGLKCRLPTPGFAQELCRASFPVLRLIDRIVRGRAARSPTGGAWCPGAESNHRHCDFQSHALPTELPGRGLRAKKPNEPAGYSGRGRRCLPSGCGMLPCPRRIRDIVEEARERTTDWNASPWKAALFRILLFAVAARNDIGPGQPAVQVDIAAAWRAERAHVVGRRTGADRAAVDRLGGGGRGGRFVGHRHLFRHDGAGVHPVEAQTPVVLSQPKRIGNPSPESRLTVS